MKLIGSPLSVSAIEPAMIARLSHIIQYIHPIRAMESQPNLHKCSATKSKSLHINMRNYRKYPLYKVLRHVSVVPIYRITAVPKRDVQQLPLQRSLFVTG